MTLNRYSAFATHLGGSIVVALLTSALVFFVLYPGRIATAAGVADIFFIILGVDVVIGPLITLIVFNRKKKELKRDLLIVLLLQIAALGYGLHTVWIARPVYEVYNAGRFDLVYANDIDDAKLKKATADEYRSLPLFGPRLVGAKAPDDRQARKDILFSSIQGGDDLPQMVQYYLPYEKLRDEVVAKQQPLDKLRTTNPRGLAEVEALEKKYSGRPVGFVPMRGKVKDLTVVVDAKTAEVLEFVPLEPW
jgi:hypothetical protein